MMVQRVAFQMEKDLFVTEVSNIFLSLPNQTEPSKTNTKKYKQNTCDTSTAMNVFCLTNQNFL